MMFFDILTWPGQEFCLQGISLAMVDWRELRELESDAHIPIPSSFLWIDHDRSHLVFVPDRRTVLQAVWRERTQYLQRS